MDKYSLPVCTEVFSSGVEKISVFEAVLPEYCPGIRKILKADATAHVTDSSLNAGIINIRCECDVRILYSGENGNLKSVAFPHFFECTMDASKIQSDSYDTSLFVKVSVLKVYAKQKNARSADVKLEASVSASVNRFEDVLLFSSDETCETETKCETKNVTKHSIIEKDDGEITDTITLDSSLPAASELIDRSICLMLNDEKPENGILKYNGNAIFKCTYRTVPPSESSESEYIYLKKDIPFDGEIACEQITDGTKSVLDINLTALDVNLSADPYGENRVIGVSASYCTHAELFSDKDVEFTKDGFCASYECDFENTTYCYHTFANTIKKEEKMTETVPLNGTNLTEITDTELKIGNYFTELAEEKIYAVAKAQATITGSDDKGEPCCIDHRFTIKQCIDDSNLSSDRKYVVCCRASAGNASLKDGGLTIEYLFESRGAILEKLYTKAISGANICYDKPKPLCRSEYIIYYPDKKETLWDIAKKYEIPQKKLAAANGLDESQPLNRKTMLIPCIL